MRLLEKVYEIKVFNDDYKPRWLHKLAIKITKPWFIGHYVMALLKNKCHSEHDPLMRKMYLEGLRSGNQEERNLVSQVFYNEMKLRNTLKIK